MKLAVKISLAMLLGWVFVAVSTVLVLTIVGYWKMAATPPKELTPMEQYVKGVQYLHAGKNAAGFKLVLKAAERGYVGLSLGNCYAEGRGVRKNEKEAFKWYLRAAQQGSDMDIAQAVVGSWYEEGRGVEKNEAEAFRYYSMEGAARGWPCKVARCYEHGIGVEKNIDEAIKWYRKSIAKGGYWPDSVKALKRLGASESPETSE